MGAASYPTSAPLQVTGQRLPDAPANLRDLHWFGILGTHKNAASKRDATLREFEERDLGGDISAAGTARMIRPQRATMPTSIVLERDLVEKLRRKGAKRGLGYQTMLKVIVREHVDEH